MSLEASVDGARPLQSLSTLCSICHLKPPQYKCPRCYTRTCSATCITLHKKRTLCSGKRNPGAYATKKELNNPAAFDMDFNFQSSVERGIESAARDAERRGTFRASTETSRGGSQRGSFPLQKSLEADGITIWKAPEGMEIAKSNKTRWGRNNGGVNWTLKWTLQIWVPDDNLDSREKMRLLQGYGRPSQGTQQSHEKTTVSQSFTDWHRDQQAESRLKSALQLASPTAREDEEHRPWRKESQLRRVINEKKTADEQDRQGMGADMSGPQDTKDTRQEGYESYQSKFKFYLEAPDLGVPGKTALIPFDGWDRNLRLKDVFMGRTFREFPHIWVWESGPPPADKFLILAPFAQPDLKSSASGKGKPTGQPAAIKRPANGGLEASEIKKKRSGKSNLQYQHDSVVSRPSLEQSPPTPVAEPEPVVHVEAKLEKVPTQREKQIVNQIPAPSSFEKKPVANGLAGLDYSSE